MSVMTQVMIGALTAQVGRLQAAIQALQACEDDGTGPVAPRQAVEVAPEVLHVTRRGIRRVKVPAEARRTGKAATGAVRQVLEACAKLPEPFDQVAVFSCLRGGMKVKVIGGNLKYLAQTGRLKCVEKGSPRHPSKFRMTNKGRVALGDASRGPKAVPEERVAVPGLDGKNGERTRDTVERELKEACAERDRSRASGREAMATIMQSKADKLQKELEELERI